jgi:plastocyanin
MKHLKVSIIFVGVLLGLSPAVLSADGVGIIKGTITIGGKLTTDTVISIESLSKEQVKPQLSLNKPQKKIMDQRNTKFIPTVVAIVVGETVDFPNNDKSWHNVYSKGGANEFDLGLYAPGKTRSQKFGKPGVSRILCNAHPNMEGFVVVKDHQFFSTTDGRGNYEIKNVPLGKVRVEIWHPSIKPRSETIEIVRAGEVYPLSVDLKKR